MQTPPRQAIQKQRRMARAFLVLVCVMYVLLLCVFSFFPEFLQLPLFGLSLTLGIPLAFSFCVIIFMLMIYYVTKHNAD